MPERKQGRLPLRDIMAEARSAHRNHAPVCSRILHSGAAKLELVADYESTGRAALFYLKDAEDARRMKLGEVDALNRATATMALRALRRLLEDPYVRTNGTRPRGMVHAHVGAPVTITVFCLFRQGAWTGSFPLPGPDEDALSIDGMAFVPSDERVFYRLDSTEDAQRRRRRLKRNYKGTTHPEAVIHVDGGGSGALATLVCRKRQRTGVTHTLFPGR